MGRGLKRDLLAPPAARAVGEILRSPGRALLPHADRSASVATPDPIHLPVTSPADDMEQEARRAEDHPPAHFDFTNVRVHADSRAAAAAQALRAKAFTVGNHIVFAPGEFAPHRERGRRLLAHELTHVHQPGSDRRLARAPVEGVEATGITLDRSNIESLTTGSYWEQKVMQTFGLTYSSKTRSRITGDAEERDAVLSSLLPHAPKARVQGPTVVNLSIPQRPTAPKSKQVLYQATFSPPATAGPHDEVLLEFQQEDAAATATPAAAPAAGYTPPTFGTADFDGFPGLSADYFKAHPDEHKQLYSWIETAPAKFAQVVTTKETGKTKKVHESSFQVTGAKDTAGAITSLKIVLLSETPTFIDTPPKGYATKDRADLELDKEQAKASDKLGQISGVDTLPTDEQLSVKYVVWQYFSGGTRNKEVDVTIPIANKTSNVFYTLRFRPNNDVDVERVGDPDSNEKLKATGLNITRVEGFADNSKDASSFSAWIKARYPTVKVAGTTLPEQQDSVNKDMAANAGSVAWFAGNYGITVLDDTAAATRLTDVHHLAAGQAADTKVFDPAELKSLEFALETMSAAELKLLQGVQFARQQVFLRLSGKIITPQPSTSGNTFSNGAERTVVIYDNVSLNDKALFLGGKSGVREENVETYTHELGHALGGKNNLEAAFKTFVAAKHIKPITSYAASKLSHGDTESFPEAFAFYQNDPEWMQSNLPDLFNWFEAVKKTGSPPKP